MGKRLTDENRLSVQRPDLAAQLVNPADARNVTEYSNKKLLWFCEEGHPRWEWEAVVYSRSSDIGCSVCAGRSVLVGWNDLGTRRPDLAAQLLNPSDAQTVTEGSHKKLLWFCEEGHPRWEWEAVVYSRSKGNGCPVCTGRSILVGWNDLGTRRPDLAAQLVYCADAQTVTENSNKKLRWFCEDGHPRREWMAQVNSRTRGNGCSACATYGFDISKSGICYLVSGMVEDRLAIKFGISNTKGVKRRLAEHRRTGFDTIHALANFDSGQDCKDFESSLKNLMLALDIPTCASRGHNFDGKTESFFVEDSTPAFFARLGAEFTALGVRPVWVTPQAHAA
jgi:hypothetical protein